MAGNHRAIVSFARYALLGTLAGVLMGVLAGVLVEKLAPPRYEATTVVFHAPGSGGSDSGRDFIAATLTDPDLFPAIAAEHGREAGYAADLARRIRVTAPDASRPIAEIRLRGKDETALAATLDTVAQRVVTLHRTRQKAALQWQLDALDEELADARKRREEFDGAALDRTALPGVANDAIVAAANLARQLREIELGERFRLNRGSTLDERRRELSLHGLVRQLKRAQQALDDDGTVADARIERARELAIADAEILALKQTRERLLRVFESSPPLQIVRPADVEPLATDASPIAIMAGFGSLIGLLAGGFMWSANQSTPTELSAAMVEKSLRVPVLAVIPENFTDDDHQGALAQTNPQHLAVAGIRSLRIALHVRVPLADAAAPVVIAGLDDPHLAGLVVANLAVVAAQAGERVLIIDAVRGDGILPGIFAHGPGSEQAAEVRLGAGSVRLVNNDDADSAASAAQVNDGHFDRVVVHVPDPARARAYIHDGNAGIGLLVCRTGQPLAALRKAQANKLFGVVLCAYRIDEVAYLGGQDPAQAS